MRGLTNLNCIIILDSQVKEKMLSNIADLVDYGADIIENIREITPKMYNKTKDVVIVGNYKFDSIDDLKVHKDLLNLNLFLITDDELLKSLLGDFCKCVVMDYRTLNSNMIYSVLKNDLAEQSRFKLDMTHLTPKKELENILDNSGDKMLRSLCMDNLRLREILEDKINVEEGFAEKIRKLESEKLQHIRENTQLSSSLTDLVHKAMKQNEVLREYKIALSRDFYDRIYLTNSEFRDRPKILYFKEYEEIIHEKSFIRTLFRSLTEQGKMSVKVVRLHDSFDSMRIKKLERDYYTVSGEFIESKIVKEDYIISYGGYERLLKFLLRNKYKLDILIIIDCKKFNDIVINGTGISYYYLCRNLHTSKLYNLLEERTISNNNDSLMSWNTYPQFSELSDDLDRRFLFLSSTNTIKSIFSNVKNII